MKKQLFWVLVALTVFVGFLVHRDAASAADMSAAGQPLGPVASATIATWGFETATTTNTGQTPVVSAGSAAADSGALTAGSSFTASHASASTVWSNPAGNGSSHSLSSNNWAPNDYIQFQFSTTGFSGISLNWDQTGSSTGPRDFKVQYSTDGSNFTDATGTNSTYQALVNGSPNTAWTAATFNPVFNLTLDLSSVTALNNQALVTIRLVNTSTVSTNGGTVATTGTERVDNFTALGTASTGTPTPTPAPAVSQVNPVSGPTTGNTNVTITGTNFISGATVSFGGTAATNVTVVNATQITATAPAHAAGTVHVTVTTSGGTSATSANDQYTYQTAGASTLQLSANSYSVGEGDGHVVVTVQRSGDTSTAATVDYATSDGTAKQKSDYEIALGTLNFAAGQAEQTVTLLIVDDAFVEGNEAFAITLSNPTGSSVSLGAVTTANVNIADNDVNPTTVNPWDKSASFFVRQNYLDFLNREPDTSGFNFWVSEITNCGNDAQCIEVKRMNVSAAFFLSIEFKETGLEAIMAHRAAFGILDPVNNPTIDIPVTYTNFMHDAQELDKGVIVGATGWEAVVEANKVAYFNDFTTRAAFLAKYPLSLTNSQYVDNILTTAGLPTNDSFRNSLVTGLNNASETRASVMRKISENTTFKNNHFNAAFVLMQYFGYLRRDPNASPDTNYDGYTFWLNKLNSFGGNYITSEMVKAFVQALETRARFGDTSQAP